MFTTITAEKLEYRFTTKDGKELKINYIWTVDKKTAEDIIKMIGDWFERDAFYTRQELLDRKLINTNKGIISDAFAAIDAKYGCKKEAADEDMDNPL